MPQYHNEVQTLVNEAGNDWLEPSLVKKIFVKESEEKTPRIAGALVEENGKTKFIAADYVHFTGGYMANLEIENSKNLALSSPTTTATGVSSNIILKRNKVIENFIENFGNTGQLAITNSHWTMLAKNDEYVILRVTGGGNTGSEEYNPNYFLNNMANTVRIFSDETQNSPLVGVIRTYGCPRSINAINATEFEELATGFIASHGKGGTGNTKRFSEAVIALSELGFEKEVIDYFSKFKTAKGENLGSDISQMIADFRKEKAFIKDSKERIAKEIGYLEKTIFDLDINPDPDEIANSVLGQEVRQFTASKLQQKSKEIPR